MRVILTTILSLFLLSLLPTFGLSQERPETIVIPVSSVGDVTETRKLILQNILKFFYEKDLIFEVFLNLLKFFILHTQTLLNYEAYLH